MSPQEALSVHAPFDRLSAAERGLVARAARPVAFAPGAVIYAADRAPGRLIVAVEGGAVSGGASLPPVFDLAAVLLARAPSEPVVAGPQGLRGFAVARAHLFTLVRECPEILAGAGGAS